MASDSPSRSPTGIDTETVSTMLGGIRIDPKTFSPLPPAPEQGLDYLYVDELPLGPPGMPGVPEPRHKAGKWGPLPMRTDGDKMLYGTGAAYMAGLSSGGFYGVVRGLQNVNASTTRLRVNAVLNSTTRFGPWAGNNMAIMTLMFTSMDSLLSKYRETQDWSNHIGAAFATGAIFKSTAGLRQSLTMGVLGASIVSVYGLTSSWWAGTLTETSRDLFGSTSSVTTGETLQSRRDEVGTNAPVSTTTAPAQVELDNPKDQPFEKELHETQSQPQSSTSPQSDRTWLQWLGIGGSVRAVEDSARRLATA
ncbi:hypothetical protein M427DRAFT_53428 [Gonapodya prolifera JEL478]|uniref:Tim17-domain-containing protein n=1 Tax=Gonapodya prolifera (strain JEL478) TaxID=1344416 RepID=A0A139AQF6_GONPJ|nr:hypothetical protein M427DRAFT_53428 [Gonapodya prolifera JEL478]|eukprot:KXS18958.1 hypothetical protein M427DRAFT_53428 [Gonapodya prolifera JEL478]